MNVNDPGSVNERVVIKADSPASKEPQITIGDTTFNEKQGSGLFNAYTKITITDPTTGSSKTFTITRSNIRVPDDEDPATYLKSFAEDKIKNDPTTKSVIQAGYPRIGSGGKTTSVTAKAGSNTLTLIKSTGKHRTIDSSHNISSIAPKKARLYSAIQTMKTMDKKDIDPIFTAPGSNGSDSIYDKIMNGGELSIDDQSTIFSHYFLSAEHNLDLSDVFKSPIDTNNLDLDALITKWENKYEAAKTIDKVSVNWNVTIGTINTSALPAGPPNPVKRKKHKPQTIPDSTGVVNNWNGTKATKISGTKIGHNVQNFGIAPNQVQDLNSYGYDWYDCYSNDSDQKLNTPPYAHPGALKAYGDPNEDFKNQAHYANEAQRNNAGAIIAHKGPFSNVDQKSFHDPVTGEIFGSAEHMLHYYKMPPTQQGNQYRQEILTKTPKGALGHAKSYMNANVQHLDRGTKWGKYNTSLEIYMQLVKASEPSTGLADALKESGDAFLIEDTAYRRAKHNDPEYFHGDNGNGTGQNKLGYSQMVARDIIKQNGGKPLTQQQLIDWFSDNVTPQLQEYYNEINNYNGPVN